MIAVLLAMYSRIKNPRGLRGIFIDSFLPQILGSFTRECTEQFGDNVENFLKERDIKSLDQFITHSTETSELFNSFLRSIHVDPKFLALFASAEKLRKFLSTWLDKYGHNSIARTATLHICFEGISILAAKSIEWTRPGAGYIELSTRYVDMSGKDLYPVENELRILGVHPDFCDEVSEESKRCFEVYKSLEGDAWNGPLPQFLAKQYQNIIPVDKLKQGVIGETCDLLGNILPCSTLTSLGGSFSGESLVTLIQHLWMDMLPETNAIAEAIIAEANKVGANQFLRHLETTPWQEAMWNYLSPVNGTQASFSVIPSLAYTEKALMSVLTLQEELWKSKSIEEVIRILSLNPRGEYDKLPREFETVSVGFYGGMSFRGWRDLQRMGLCAHKRGLVSAFNGFYTYTKPAPQVLIEAFNHIHLKNGSIETRLLYAAKTHRENDRKTMRAIMQYPLVLGNMVPFYMTGNLRQMEFCNWQRSKPSVNHEVREVFLSFEYELRNAYPWWGKISRADTTPAYVFARGDSDIPLSKVT
ncbi:MAG: FAD-dependent thymidylate synthase [bacterium]|nr:FAD-dependent thymidylate synthase [bacterium]